MGLSNSISKLELWMCLHVLLLPTTYLPPAPLPAFSDRWNTSTFSQPLRSENSQSPCVLFGLPQPTFNLSEILCLQNKSWIKKKLSSKNSRNIVAAGVEEVLNLMSHHIKAGKLTEYKPQNQWTTLTITLGEGISNLQDTMHRLWSWNIFSYGNKQRLLMRLILGLGQDYTSWAGDILWFQIWRKLSDYFLISCQRNTIANPKSLWPNMGLFETYWNNNSYNNDVIDQNPTNAV